MLEQTYDHIGELERAVAAVSPAGGAESLLNELSGAFEEPIPSEQPVQAQPLQAEQPVQAEPVQAPAVAETPREEGPVVSPPRLEPPTMIWKPERRARFKLRRK